MLVMTSTLVTHWFQFFFVPVGKPWYEGNVWGNVVAVLPLAILGAAGFTYHHFVLKRLHEEHSQHLKALLDILDPATDGGISDVHAAIAEIRDALDTKTPGGLNVVLDEVRKLNGNDVTLHRNDGSVGAVGVVADPKNTLTIHHKTEWRG